MCLVRSRHLARGSDNNMVARTHSSCRCRVVLAGLAVRLSVGAAQHNRGGDARASLTAQEGWLPEPAGLKMFLQFNVFNHLVVLFYDEKREVRLPRTRCKRHFRS